MDLLFSKYASPFLLLDQYLACGQFFDFIVEFIQIENERKEYEYWLHKVWDKSFDEFKNVVERQEEDVDEFELETTISESRKVLSSFIPEDKGVNDGTI
jgi:hypothetical protein